MAQTRALEKSPSYYHSPRITPYQYTTIPACLKEWAKKRPDKPAVIIRCVDKPRQQLTFSELYQSANRFASGLMNLGVGKGAKVALCVRNSIEWMIGFYGIVSTGAIAVTAMSFHPETCLISALETGCVLIVLDTRHVASKGDLNVLLDGLRRRCAEKQFDPNKIVLVQSTVKADSMLDFDELVKGEHCQLSFDTNLDPDDVCFTLPTSGSTGKSKYILHSHFATINGSRTMAKMAGLSEVDIYFSDRPMGYSGGYPHFLVSCGVTHVYCETHTTATPEITEFILDVLRDEKATSALILPYLLYDLLKSERGYDVTPRLKWVMIGGQMMNNDMMEGLCRFTEEPIFIYGMSEVLGYFMALRRQLLQMGEPRLGGFPGEGIEVKIIDDENHVVPFGSIGEICLRCRYTCREYFRGVEIHEPALDTAGWFHTADMGTLREDGYLIIEGRKKDMIKRGTLKIYPEAVEVVLKEHSSVDEVCVVGIPDERLFEEVCACVVLHSHCSLNANDIQGFANQAFQPKLSPDGRGLMPGKFVIMENIPRLANGKVDRNKLKEICS